MRREDWPDRLAAIVEQARDVPFLWGSHDCVHWAISVAEELTGAPFGPALPEYGSATGAMRVLRGMGFDGLLEAVTHHLGPQMPVPMAQRGDLLLIPTDVEGWPFALGVCLGSFAATPGENGLTFVPIGRAVAAWRV